MAELEPDDPFIAVIAPGERVWTSIAAVNWSMRKVPGTPRELTARHLTLTNRRLLSIGPLLALLIEPDVDEAEVTEVPYDELGLPSPASDAQRAGMREFAYARVANIGVKRTGFQGLLGFDYEGHDGQARFQQYSMHVSVAQVLAAKMKALWGEEKEAQS